MARTMDLSFLRFIKKEEHGNSIIKQQHTPTATMFSFMFTSLKKEQQHNNNKPSSSSSVDVTEDDRVCLHFSVGDPSCPSCDYQQQLLTDNNKKRKRDPQQQQQTLKNKKARINNNWREEELKSSSVCLHLMLASPSCIPTCIHQAAAADDDHEWEMKKILEKSDVCLHLSRLLIKKEVAQQFIIPVLMLAGATEEAAYSKDGIQVQVRDVDTDSLHTLVFKIWSSAKSHIFTKRWLKDFVLRRDLKKGDQIGLRWDQGNNRFDFSVLRRANKD
ncbi:B3 domain-containing protein [Trifolium repens]|nr:B3 domain-containing protein [Trifolium repens]